MALAKSLFGSTRNIPQTRETTWGAVVTAVLADLIDAVDALGYVDSEQGYPRLEPADSTLAASATLTPSRPQHRVQGSGGAVALDGTTAIADGVVDGQLLELVGDHATNTVRVPDGANTDLNGGVILGLGEAIGLAWDDGRSVWVERYRTT